MYFELKQSAMQFCQIARYLMELTFRQKNYVDQNLIYHVHLVIDMITTFPSNLLTRL